MKILITGASGGIGSEITKELVKNNEVIAVGRDVVRLKLLKKYLKSKNFSIIKMDVSDINSVKKAFLKIDDIDVLINCAGILGPVCLFGESDMEKWDETVKVDLLGTVYLTYFALPLLLRSKRGKIINFSGGGSAYGRAFHTAYAVSKVGVVRFTESLALEYPNLDINAIAPGAHKTNMWRDEKHDKEPENWGDIERLKDFIVYLCSEKSNGITGRFIHYKDNWETFDKDNLSKDMFTLRRVE